LTVSLKLSLITIAKTVN